jgi:hypothetical protein
MGPPPSPGERARGGRGPIEYNVRLTHVASINPEYETFIFPGSTYSQRISRVLQGFLQGHQSSNDNTVLTAITVCTVISPVTLCFHSLPG